MKFAVFLILVCASQMSFAQVKEGEMINCTSHPDNNKEAQGYKFGLYTAEEDGTNVRQIYLDIKTPEYVDSSIKLIYRNDEVIPAMSGYRTQDGKLLIQANPDIFGLQIGEESGYFRGGIGFIDKDGYMISIRTRCKVVESLEVEIETRDL